jgi:hydroxymethylpyrimidine kinase/phosphomethylpyrimidine kinase
LTDPAPPVALTIAGSDSGGGAGIQADIKTFQAFGVFGTSAVTAITAQDTVGVRVVHPLDPALVTAQIDAVLEDLRPTAVKSGMLATASIASAVADALDAHADLPYVLDPVLVSSTGHRLLDADAVAVLAGRLLPRATLVAPNLPEARILTSLAVEGEAGQREAARRLVELGAAAALVTGGHGEGDEVVDVLWDGAEDHVWRRPRIATRNTHGTGCTVSAAITARLAGGSELVAAVDEALSFVWEAIRTAPGLGLGHGPLNHFVRPRDDRRPLESDG